MSGDVQARKRKEKRRKKDDEDSGTVSPPVANLSESLSDNVTIHIYKESNTGGHWCARIIFFVLLTILIGLVGTIIFEHRGTTDINTPLESSRWAFLFDGWVDDSLSLSNGGLHEEKEQEEYRNVEEDEEKQEEDETEHEEDETEQEEDETEQEEDEIEQEEDETEQEEDETEQEEDEIEQEEDETEQEEDETEENYDTKVKSAETGNSKEENEEEEDEEINKYDQNDSLQDEEVEDVSTELNNQRLYEDENERNYVPESADINSQNLDDTDVLEEFDIASDEKNLDERKDILYRENNQFDEILETPTSEDVLESLSGIPGIDDILEDNMEPLEEVESTEPEEIVSDPGINKEIEEETEEESASGGGVPAI